jgi:hypothetical protein
VYYYGSSCQRVK